MPVETVAVLSPGDMGHAVGRVLGENGLNVITCLGGRSTRTRKLAHAAAIRDVSNLNELVLQADLVLSILVPSEAVNIAQQIAHALTVTGASTPFADCNAVSPQTAETMHTIITSGGGRFIDASIIGNPPGRGVPPRFYVSGEYAHVMSDLDRNGIEVCLMGKEIGKASAIKMCYATLTKGTSALQVALLVAAEAMGVSEKLHAEFKYSQPEAYKAMHDRVPSLPIPASRWIGEMREIASAFGHVGVTPRFLQGAAEIYDMLSQTSFAQETPETLDHSRTMVQTILAIAQSLPSSRRRRDCP